MGKVSDYVLSLVRQHLAESGPVVWFDAEGAYGTVVACLEHDVPVYRYEGSFLELRRDVDPHMNGLEPPTIVVYVPLDEPEAQDALVELTAAGIVLRPGHPSHPCNTRLSVIARAALKGIVPDSLLDDILRKVEAAQLNLADLDDLAERGAPDLSGLSLVFGTPQPDEITLRFLSDPTKDESLVSKGAVPDLERLASEEYGVDVGASDDVGTIRSVLSSHLLAADCLLSTGKTPPTSGSVTLPEGSGQQPAIRRVAATWRNRVDLMDSYRLAATQAEAMVDLSALPDDLEALAETETFAANDDTVQKLVAASLCDRPEDSLVDTARRRQRTYWGRQPESNARWQLITAAGDLLLECRRVTGELATVSAAQDMVRRYAEGERPWCELDTAQRRMERLYPEFEDIAAYPEIEKLVSRARLGYQDVASGLAERFVGALEAGGFALGGPGQRHTYAKQVKPLLEQGKVAYFLVDAMRYEMGRELSHLLADEGEIHVFGVLASAPTITEIGMASLMPRAEGPVEVVDAGGGNLTVKVGGVLLGNRAERMAFLEEHSGVPTVILKLEDFQPFRQATRRQAAEAQLIVVTSQEIDMVGEADNSVFARQTMGQVLDMILRAVRALARVGIERFVIAADHGHLFGEETLSDMLIERPGGGHQVDLHRRVWVGRGGAVVPNTVRAKISKFGLGGDLEMVTPRTLGCFKAPGANSFFHGGLSLQELVVPVILVRTRKEVAPVPGIRWKLSGPRRMTTRVYSVSIGAEAAGLFSIEAPRVRVELRSAGKKVGRIQDADYGLAADAEEIALRTTPDGRWIEENHVTFVLDEVGSATELEVRLLDARTEQVLDKMEHVEVAVSL